MQKFAENDANVDVLRQVEAMKCDLAELPHSLYAQRIHLSRQDPTPDGVSPIGPIFVHEKPEAAEKPWHSASDHLR